MKILKLGFKSASGKKHTLNLQYNGEKLSASKIRTQMQTIAAAHLFVQAGEEIYQQPVSAKYVDTIETVLF